MPGPRAGVGHKRLTALARPAPRRLASFVGGRQTRAMIRDTTQVPLGAIMALLPQTQCRQCGFDRCHRNHGHPHTLP